MRRLMPLVSLLVMLSAAPAAQAAWLFDAAPADGLDIATVQMSRLPSWLQVSGSSARLFGADSADGSTIARVARFTFMRVLGGGASRLLVDVYDDNGNPGLRGWVDPVDVLPSAGGTDWRVSATPTTLRKEASVSAQPIRTLDRFMALQQIDGPVQNQILVLVYRADFTILDQGWVDLADTGPAFPPRTLIPSPTLVARRTLPSPGRPEQAFLNATAEAARVAAAQTGVPASVTVAQAILESDWGRSLLSQTANNYFGIKATSRLGNDGLVWMSTSEYTAEGDAYDTISPFRAYKSLIDSMTDHARLLLGGRYAGAMQVASDPKLFAQQLSEAGYSTDPDYADKLIALMDGYNLYRLDA